MSKYVLYTKRYGIVHFPIPISYLARYVLYTEDLEKTYFARFGIGTEKCTIPYLSVYNQTYPFRCYRQLLIAAERQIPEDAGCRRTMGDVDDRQPLRLVFLVFLVNPIYLVYQIYSIYYIYRIYSFTDYIRYISFTSFILYIS